MLLNSFAKTRIADGLLIYGGASKTKHDEIESLIGVFWEILFLNKRIYLEDIFIKKFIQCFRGSFS